MGRQDRKGSLYSKNLEMKLPADELLHEMIIGKEAAGGAEGSAARVGAAGAKEPGSAGLKELEK